MTATKHRHLPVTLSASVCLLFLCACDGSQSALAPAGKHAVRVANLFWGLTIGTAVIWAVVVGLALHATYFSRSPLSSAGGHKVIIWGGIVAPSIILVGLLSYSLSLLSDLLAPAPEGALTIRVTGHQWWWRVNYTGTSQEAIEVANEIHLPVGKPVEFQLEASDVIHSFWIPSLGGKVDMIPGRQTRLVLEPTRVGTYRGACAEYCGTSHALMNFTVVVEPEHEFQQWLALQAQSARLASAGADAQGAELFLANGCGACHSVRGTQARGVIAPDLTHVGSRRSIGAGVLAANSDAFLRFISRPGEVKPSVHMPAFDMLSAHDLQLISHYLEGLK